MTSVNATSSTDAARQALIRGMLASGISVNTMMPSNNAEDATRSFRFATDKDPLMCDAWLGRILTGEDSAKILYGAWNARDTFGWEIRRLGGAIEIRAEGVRRPVPECADHLAGFVGGGLRDSAESQRALRGRRQGALGAGAERSV